MAWIKRTFLLMLSMSVLLAGFPAQAKPECPMAKMMQEMAMQDMEKDHDCCPKAEQEKQQKKSGCCDDAACNAQCMGVSNMSMHLPSIKAALPSVSGETLRLYPADAALASQHLNAQERPPKSLS